MTKEHVVLSGIDSARVRGLLFDVDGTLSNTDDQMVDRFSRILEPVSWLFRDHSPRRFARWVIMAIETPTNIIYRLADRFGIDRPLLNFYNRLSRKRRAQKAKHDRFWIIPGIREMLESFKGRYPMAVVSARDAETTTFFLEHFGLLSYFDAVVTAHICEHTKPFPDPVIYAADQLGLKPEECLMIGDTIMDVYAGKSAGAQTVAVLCGFGTQRELSRAGANLILAKTPDLEEILAG